METQLRPFGETLIKRLDFGFDADDEEGVSRILAVSQICEFYDWRWRKSNAVDEHDRICFYGGISTYS
jgi:hypothetical protein